jgi:hypothetical protein
MPPTFQHIAWGMVWNVNWYGQCVIGSCSYLWKSIDLYKCNCISLNFPSQSLLLVKAGDWPYGGASRELDISNSLSMCILRIRIVTSIEHGGCGFGSGRATGSWSRGHGFDSRPLSLSLLVELIGWALCSCSPKPKKMFHADQDNNKYKHTWTCRTVINSPSP